MEFKNNSFLNCKHVTESKYETQLQFTVLCVWFPFTTETSEAHQKIRPVRPPPPQIVTWPLNQQMAAARGEVPVFFMGAPLLF